MSADLIRLPEITYLALDLIRELIVAWAFITVPDLAELVCLRRKGWTRLEVVINLSVELLAHTFLEWRTNRP